MSVQRVIQRYLGPSISRPTPSEREQQQIKQITQGIRAASDDIRRQYPMLRHQNAIGLGFLLLACAGFIASASLYFLGIIPLWASVIGSAFFASITHELEHDLIHRMYFRKHPVIHDLMMLAVWLVRPNLINPWVRRHIHMHHHKVSGSEFDHEERSLGNGMAWSFKRLIITIDTLASIIIRRRDEYKQTGEKPRTALWKVLMVFMPVGLLYYLPLYTFILFQLINGALAVTTGQGLENTVVNSVMSIVNIMMVIFVLPNLLRSACLNFISSNMHYYGDVDNMLQETQVLNAWYYFPFHLFCCNFGSTHAIHHFVVKDPFYVRQLTAKAAHKVMRENGIRFNDHGSFLRANRYQYA